MRLDIKADVKVIALDLPVHLAPEVAMDLEFFLNSMGKLAVTSLKDGTNKEVAVRFHFHEVEVKA